MTSLDNYCTHYCPDSGFSLISENDFEFEACNCFRTAVGAKAASSAAQTDAAAAKSSPILAEQVWYRTIAALAKVCGTAKPVQLEKPIETPVTHENEEALAHVRKR